MGILQNLKIDDYWKWGKRRFCKKHWSKNWSCLSWSNFELVKFCVGQILSWSNFELVEFWVGRILSWSNFELVEFWVGLILSWSNFELVKFWVRRMDLKLCSDHFPTKLCRPRGLCKDLTVWPVGASPHPISLNMHLTNLQFDQLRPYLKSKGLYKWKRINCKINHKQSTRWQHLSRLKPSAFFSLRKNLVSCMKRNNLHLGLVMPSSGWWSLIGTCCTKSQWHGKLRTFK